MNKETDIITDLLTDFDEMGFAPTILVPDPEGYAVEWREKLTNALQGYRKQSEGEWIYHECVSSYDGAISGYSCSECCIFVNEEMFDSDEFHKDFCGHCGAKMKGGAE